MTRFFRKSVSLFVALPLILLWACGPQPQGAPPPTNPKTTNPCATGSTDAVCADGLTAACKEGLGINTDCSNPDCDNDGIKDAYDNPDDCKDPSKVTDDCDEYCQSNRSRIYEEMANDLLLGSSAIANSAPQGMNVNVSVEKQELHIVSKGEGGSDAQSLATFCGSETFIYLSFQGKVGICGTSTSTCTLDSPAKLELCGELMLPSEFTQHYPSGTSPKDPLESGKISIVFKKAKGMQHEFDPRSLASGSQISTTVTFKASNPKPTCSGDACKTYGSNDNYSLYRNLLTTLETKDPFRGTFKLQDGTVITVGGTITINEKKWSRVGPIPVDDTRTKNSPGILGFWSNTN